MEAVAISGFEVTGSIHEGETFRLLRARRMSDGREVCLKTTVAPYPGPRALAQLHNEFAIGGRLRGDSFPEYLEKVTEGSRIFVVMQQLRGVSLRDYLRAGSPGERKLLDIAIALCGILRDLEANQIIHKDIKPENLILDEKTGRVYLIDFGLSTQSMRTETDHLIPDQLEGTPAYLSPEQTGKTNWSIDHRTDFYAFGCILYLFFTGRLPFVSEDPLELLHYQVALAPAPPIRLNERLPVPLSDLILKLLAKSPFDRYHTADGIYQDLLRIRDDWDRPALLAEFRIGQRDIPTRFFFTQQIFGRESELAQMHEAFRAVEKGEKRLLMIEGAPGVGKTELVQAFRNQLLDTGLQFASGSFSETQEDFSRSGFAGMLRQILKGMLALDEQALEGRRERLRQYLGGNLALLAPILPELELICGEQGPPGSLSGQEERNRFFYAMVSLIRALHLEELPWVMFLDDLHWADPTSLRLVEELAFGTETAGILLIGCFRGGTALEGRPLPESLDRLQKSGLTGSIHLPPLSLAATRELVGAALGAHPRPDELAHFLFSRTDGVPLLQNQLLWLIQEQGLFRYNAAEGYWDYDQEALKRLPLSKDFAELARNRVATLPRATVDVLSTAAVLGFRFSRQILVSLAGIAEPEVERALLRATGKGIIISTQATKALQAFPQDHRFMHRSLHQHFYSLRAPDERERLHLRIGELLMDLSGRMTTRNPQAYEILAHLNQARDLVKSREARRELVDLNHSAAREARLAGQYEQAVHYWQAALGIIAAEPSIVNGQERFEMEFQAAQTHFLAGQHQTAEEILLRLMEECDPAHYLSVVRSYCQLLIAEGRHEDVLKAGEKALARSRVSRPLPKGNSRIRFSLLRGMVGLRMKLRGRRMERIPDLPPCTHQEVVEIIRLYRDLGISALSINPALFGVVVLREVELTLRYGLHPYAVTAFMSFAIMTTIGLKDYKTALKLGELAFLLRDRDNSGVEFPESDQGYLHFLLHLHKPVREHLAAYLDNHEQLMQAGNPVFAGYTVNSRVWSMVCLGIPLDEVREEMAGYVRSFEMKGEEEGVDMMMPRLQFILGLQGAFPEPWKLRHEGYDFDVKFASLEARGSFSVLGGMVIARLQLCWLFGEYDEGLKVIARGDRFIPNMEGMLFVADYYLYHGLTYAMLARRHGQTPSSTAKKRLKAIRKVMHGLARQQPDNYTSHQTLLIAGHTAMDPGKPSPLSSLETAISAARRYKFTPNFAVANELVFRWCGPDLSEEDRFRHLFDAHQAYLLWGATAKAAALEAEFPTEFARKQPASSPRSGTGSFPTQSGNLDLQSILKASQAIAREIRLPQLVATLTRVVVENAAAEKGCFILQTGGKLSLEVVGEMQDETFVTRTTGKGLDESLVPVSMIRYVARTAKVLALTPDDDPGHFRQDPYLITHRPQTVLCHPVVHQGHLIGIVYLESRLVSQSFNAARMELLALLSGQMGISLQNALHYEQLEDKVRERTRTIEHQKLEIEQEKRKSDELLRNILPDAVARQLKEEGRTTPRRFERVSILFSDIVNFTRFAERRSPEELVRDLDRYFGAVDAIMERYGLEKVKTIGDAYLCVGGLAEHPPDIHISTIRAAKAMLELVERQKSEGLDFDIRIGIHTGPVVAGVVGTKKFAYDIWGDAVNVAARMESTGAPGRINVSHTTRELLGEAFAFEARGVVEAKHKGEMEMYWVVEK